MGLLKKGAVCPVSLFLWVMPTECMVTVWWPPTPAMGCDVGGATLPLGLQVTLLHKICIHYLKRQNVKLGLAGRVST